MASMAPAVYTRAFFSPTTCIFGLVYGSSFWWMMLASRDIEEYGCIEEAFKNVKLILDPK